MRDQPEVKSRSFLALIREEFARRDDHHDGAPRRECPSGLPSGPTSRAEAVPHGASLTTTARRRRFSRDTDGRAELEFRFEKRDGDLGVGSKPVHLKLAVVRDAVVKVIPKLARRKSRIVESAVH